MNEHKKSRMIIVFCLGFLSTCYSQDKELISDSLMFDEIINTYYGEGNPETALRMCRNFVQLYPSSKYTSRVYFNAGCFYREIGNSEAAIPLFKKIIHHENYDEFEPFGGIMEQYALFKNRSSKHLAEIYLELEDYENAYKYILLFDKVHKYQHFCGNELTANEIYTSVMYAKYYNGVNKPEKSIRALVPNMINNKLASNSDLIALLRDVLINNYDENELYEIFEEAVNGIRLRRKGYAIMNILGVRVKVYDDFSYYLSEEKLEEMKANRMEPYLSTLRANQLFQEFYFERK